MAKITRTDIIGPLGLGFTQELFSVIAATAAAFDTLVDAVIAEVSLELEGRIGSALYADATVPNATYVKLVEKYLTAAEMLSRRINIVLGSKQGKGEDISIDAEQKQLQAYLDKVYGNQKANPPVIGLIEKIVSGSLVEGTGFASGSLVTSHFEA